MTRERLFRAICLWLEALGLKLETDTPVWGIAHRIVCEVVRTVVWSFVLQAVSYIVPTVVSYIICGAVWDVTRRSASSVVSLGIRSGARPATPPIALEAAPTIAV
jgi:uncharacterized membrane protein